MNLRQVAQVAGVVAALPPCDALGYGRARVCEFLVAGVDGCDAHLAGDLVDALLELGVLVGDERLLWRGVAWRVELLEPPVSGPPGRHSATSESESLTPSPVRVPA